MAIHPPTLVRGLCGSDHPVRLCHRGAHRERPVEGMGRCAASVTPCSRGCSWASASALAPCGPTWCSAGAATGAGTPWKTPACCRGCVGVALIHSFTVYRQRGAFKRWCGHVRVHHVRVRHRGHVHLAFGLRAVRARLRGRPGVARAVRRRSSPCRCWPASWAWSFAGRASARQPMAPTIWRTCCPRTRAYYFNNVIMIVFTTHAGVPDRVTRRCLGSLPFGGQTVSSGTYNAIARPLGVLYLRHPRGVPAAGRGARPTAHDSSGSSARIPAICALVLFAVLMVVLRATYLVPSVQRHHRRRAAPPPRSWHVDGPAWYYNGLARRGLLRGQHAAVQLAVHAGPRIVRSYKRVA